MTDKDRKPVRSRRFFQQICVLVVSLFVLIFNGCKKSAPRLNNYQSSELRRELERRKSGEPTSAPEEIAKADTQELIQALGEKQLQEEKGIHNNIDHRLDWFEIQDPSIRSEADRVAGIFDFADMTQSKDTCFLPGVVLGNVIPLCSSERYVLQPAGAKCTAFVVAEDMFATAGHCIQASNMSQKRFVFGYRMTGLVDPVLRVSRSEVYTAKSIVAWEYTPAKRGQTEHFGLDYALVQVDRPIQNHPAFVLRRSGKLTTNDFVYALGYPWGLPIKFSGVGAVNKIFDDGYFSAPVDTFGGNSGSPVINSNTHEVEGVFVRGDQDTAKSDVGTCKIVSNCPDSGCLIGEQSTLVSAFLDKIPSITTKGVTTPESKPFVKVFSSGPMMSGSGSGFSDWYKVEAEPPPPGYKITSVDFSLTGDRRCNAWSECRIAEKTDTKALFEFRMQGHNEWPGSGQASSEGHLIVTYSPQAP
jgi:V8-like Glu-specific endopeptidase